MHRLKKHKKRKLPKLNEFPTFWWYASVNVGR